MDGGDGAGAGAVREAVRCFTHQTSRREIAGGVLLLLLAVDTGGSRSSPACERPFFLLQSKHILPEMWLCVCRPSSGMKALLLPVLFFCLLDQQLFNLFFL